MASYLDSDKIYVPLGGADTAGTTTADTATLTAADSGKMIVATKATATQVFTLPTAAVAGQRFTFVCGHASGEILINPITAQSIVGKIHAAQDGTGLAPAAGTGIKNTAASNVVGDAITLVSDGVTTWYITAQTGLWASQ